MKVNSIEFNSENLILIDQRKLPATEEYFVCKSYKDAAFAIKDMVVRGAPAIGITAAYGLSLAAKENSAYGFIKSAANELLSTRPTAVNLKWALDRLMGLIDENTENPYQVLLDESIAMHAEDIEINKKMAEHGNMLVEKGDSILTHCNTGALATAGYGTALGVIREAHATGKDIFVYADETRPRLQGARLTAYELVKENIPSKLIPDSAAATLIRDGKIQKIFVGADRIAANGDTANKIGTFMLSVIARHYSVPFYIVAPTSTIDLDTPDGAGIEIEERSADEVRFVGDTQVAPLEVDVFNPAFDVTPNEFITGIVTEKGVAYPPYEESLCTLF